VSAKLMTRIQETLICLFVQRQQVKQQVSFELEDIFDGIWLYIQRQQLQVERRVSTISVKSS
jgi:hypothetical protein